MLRTLALLNSVGMALGGTILWDGRFNDMTSSAALSDWSFSNEIGPYQYYIHGASNVTSYVNLDSTFKNPADTGSTQGVKITLDDTAYWEGQTMRRTELIPQTKAALGSGKVYYHFSMQRSDTNAPSEFREHQIAFFESHFTEMKSGWMSGESATSDNLLRWDVSGTTYWNTTWEAGVWHNIAYGIDFSAGTVEFYHSTGADDLTLTHAAVSVSASSNGADWHLGALELARDTYADTTEDFYFSGVYVESGDVTTSVSGPGGTTSGSSSAVASSVVSSTIAASTSSTLAVSTTSALTTSTAPTTSSSSEVIVATTSGAAGITSVASSTIISSSSEAAATPLSTATSTTLAPTTLATVVRTSTTSSTPTPTPASEDDGDECE